MELPSYEASQVDLLRGSASPGRRGRTGGGPAATPPRPSSLKAERDPHRDEMVRLCRENAELVEQMDTLNAQLVNAQRQAAHSAAIARRSTTSLDSMMPSVEEYMEVAAQRDRATREANALRSRLEQSLAANARLEVAASSAAANDNSNVSGAASSPGSSSYAAEGDESRRHQYHGLLRSTFDSHQDQRADYEKQIKSLKAALREQRAASTLLRKQLEDRKALLEQEAVLREQACVQRDRAFEELDALMTEHDQKVPATVQSATLPASELRSLLQSRHKRELNERLQALRRKYRIASGVLVDEEPFHIDYSRATTRWEAVLLEAKRFQQRFKAQDDERTRAIEALHHEALTSGSPSRQDLAQLVAVLRAMLPYEGPINSAIAEAVDQIIALESEYEAVHQQKTELNQDLAACMDQLQHMGEPGGLDAMGQKAYALLNRRNGHLEQQVKALRLEAAELQARLGRHESQPVRY